MNSKLITVQEFGGCLFTFSNCQQIFQS